MMKRFFFADQVKCYVEDDVRFLAFAMGLDDNPEMYVILSRTEFPEDEDEFGVYINSSFGLEGYDLIELKRIDKNFLLIETKPGLDQDEIKIDFSSEKLCDIEFYISKIFA